MANQNQSINSKLKQIKKHENTIYYSYKVTHKIFLEFIWIYMNSRTNKTKLLTLTFVLNKNKKYH